MNSSRNGNAQPESRQLEVGHKRVRVAVCTGESIFTPAPTASRHAFLALWG
jgi:hypothetical protein